MSSQQDILFGKTAVAFGYINPKQLSICLKIQHEFAQRGEQLSLSQVLVKKRFISESQILLIQEQSTKNAQTNVIAVSRPATQRIEAKHFGRYRVIRELGRGGMGRVYQVYDEQLDRSLALKILMSDDQESLERFLREARATAKLNHPNIVSIHDIVKEGRPFFTMDYIEGVTLQNFMRQNRLSTRQILSTMIPITKAIHYAHSEGVIHRDLKPANIMLDNDKNPYIMDFGLAKLTTENQQLSRSGIVLGTLHYMSPEQADGKIREVDHRTDVYALGVILYEMITGKPPFTGNSFTQTLSKIVEGNFVPPSKIKTRLPAQLESICLKAMAKQKEHRYQTVQDFSQDLENFLEGKRVVAKQPQSFAKKIPYIAAALVSLLVVALALTFWPNTQPFMLVLKTVDSDQKVTTEFQAQDKVRLWIFWENVHVSEVEEIEIYGKGIKYDSFVPRSNKFYQELHISNEDTQKFSATVAIKTKKRIYKQEVSFTRSLPKPEIKAPAVVPQPMIDKSIQLRSIRCFEGDLDPPPKVQRLYTSQFARDSSRCIYFEVEYNNQLYNIRDQAVNITGKYYTANRSLLAEVSYSYTCSKTSPAEYLWKGWGWREPGNWPIGEYYLEIYNNGIKIGETRFVVY